MWHAGYVRFFTLVYRRASRPGDQAQSASLHGPGGSSWPTERPGYPHHHSDYASCRKADFGPVPKLGAVRWSASCSVRLADAVAVARATPIIRTGSRRAEQRRRSSPEPSHGRIHAPTPSLAIVNESAQPLCTCGWCQDRASRSCGAAKCPHVGCAPRDLIWAPDRNQPFGMSAEWWRG